LPTHGLIQNFATTGGSFTFIPARGFRGQDRFTFQATDGSAYTANVTFNINVIAPPDPNGNGLPDLWEEKYEITDVNADLDGDGQSNLDEYFANTNPTNAASVFGVLEARRDGSGRVTLKWRSIGGIRYRVQYSNGGASGSFKGVFTDILRSLNAEMDSAPVDVPSTQTFVDDFTLTGGSASNARYYRIEIVQ
jgi:hypothetical protein